ncbi:MAG: hypothetical protein ACLFQB_10520 [Chitinispirillaceae bacterium]
MDKHSPRPVSEDLSGRFITLVLVSAFLIGTATHTADVIKQGFLGYSKIGDVSGFYNCFWTSLLFVDPLIVVLLLFKRWAGAVAAFIVIAADVAVNYSYLSTHVVTLPVWEVPSFSLQAAVLLFSFLTLPKVLVWKKESGWFGKKVQRWYSKTPHIVLWAGLMIHIYGIASLKLETATLWNIWVHFSMIVVDSLLLAALIMKLRIGFWAALVGFSLFGLIQAGFAAGSFFGLSVPFNFTMGMTLSLCCLVVSSLLGNRSELTQSVSEYFNRVQLKKKT